MDEPAAGMGDAAEETHHHGVIRGLLGSLLDAARTRLDLASVEAEIYVIHLVQMLLWAFVAVGCAVLALVFALVTIIVALWDTHKFAGLLGGFAVFAVLAIICGVVSARTFRGRPTLIEGTLQQLETDHRRVMGEP